MKKIIILFTSLIMLTSCGMIGNGSYAKQGSENSAETTKTIDSEVLNAKTIFDLKDRMTNTADFSKFSECDDDDEFAAYYDLLLISGNNYIEIENDSGDYLLFLYCYSDYGRVMENVNGIDKKYSDNTLALELEKELREFEHMGCAPDMSYCRCLIKVDEDFDKLTIDGREYTKYDGGRIYVNGKYGMADGEFNIRVPVKYDLIMNFPINESSMENPLIYYRVCTADGNGIIDENYNTVLSPIYSNIIYLGENKYMAMKKKDESNDIGNYQICVIDGDENIIHGYIDGFIDGGQLNSWHNYADQVIFGRSDGNKYLKGVINKELEVVIEPQFKNISVWCENSENQFYVVENDREEFAVIDWKGIQHTDFEKSSVYEVQTAYHEKLNNQIYTEKDRIK